MLRTLLCGLLLSLTFVRITQAQEQKIVPVSPEAASIARFINFPVNYSTGVPNINIPLYEIVSGQLRLPISINYHAGGIKVNQKSTWVGLGWNLSAEPTINRTVNSKADELDYLGTPFNQTLTYQVKKNIVNGITDRDPDEFYYNLNGSIGKFYFAITENGPKAMPVPFSHVKIDMGFDWESPSPYNEHNITDIDGTKYSFGGSNAIEIAQGGYASSWKCNQMVSSSTNDTLSFTYGSLINDESLSFREKFEVFDMFITSGDGEIPYNINYSPSALFSYDNTVPYLFGPRYLNYSTGSERGLYFIARDLNNFDVIKKPGYVINDVPSITSVNKIRKISEIKYRTGKVKFTQNTSDHTLQKIEIYDQKGVNFKTVNFYFHADGDYRLLDSLTIRDASQKKVEKYSFIYNSSQGMVYGLKNADPWGYFNGAHHYYTSESNSVPMQVVQTWHPTYYNGASFSVGTTHDITIGDTYKGISTGFNQAFVLKKIIYPTGGRAEFAYENNQTQGGIAGGLRVKNIKYFRSGNNLALEKKYKYGLNENGFGYSALHKLANYKYMQMIYYLKPKIMNGSTLVDALCSYFNERKTTYVNQSLLDMSFAGGSPVVYDRVTEYQADGGIQTGKTEFNFNYDESYINVVGVAGNFTMKADEWPWGELLSENKYAYKDGHYFWVEKKETQYQSFQHSQKIKVLKIYNQNIVKEIGYGSIPQTIQNIEGAGFTDVSNELSSGIKIPSKKITTTRNLNDTTQVLTHETSYFYDNPASIFATRISTTDSKGDVKTNYTSRPLDYPVSDPIIGPLISNNMLNLEIEKVSTSRKFGTTPTYILNGFLNTYSNKGYLLKVKALELKKTLNKNSFKFSNTLAAQLPNINNIAQYNFSPDTLYKDRIMYNRYDNRGNIQELTKDDTIKKSYLWDYNQTFPIAEVVNAPLNEVAYTSFESNGKGNWAFNPDAIDSLESRTGIKQYKLAASPLRNLLKDSLKTNQTYIVSYWTKNASPYNVSGNTGTAVLNKSLNGWNYYTHKATGQTTVTISGSGYIDEVKIYPENAQMSTYTYNPSFGLTCSTDARGMSTYYQYDSFGRLQLIKDQSGNILKAFQYHYNFEQ